MTSPHESTGFAREQAEEAIAHAGHMDDPRNPPNASGQIAIAKAILYLAEVLGERRKRG